MQRIGNSVEDMMQMALALGQETRAQNQMMDRIAPRIETTTDSTERARKGTAKLLGRSAAR